MEVIFLIIYLGFAYFVGRFAQFAFLRSFWTWFSLSVMFTPVAGFVFLLVAGIPFEKIVRDQVKQKALRKYGEEVNLHTVAECPNCLEVYDISTGFGIARNAQAPWQIVCKSCGTVIDTDPTVKR